MKMTDGCNSLATANKARTSFSPSPTCEETTGKRSKVRPCRTDQCDRSVSLRIWTSNWQRWCWRRWLWTLQPRLWPGTGSRRWLTGSRRWQGSTASVGNFHTDDTNCLIGFSPTWFFHFLAVRTAADHGPELWGQWRAEAATQTHLHKHIYTNANTFTLTNLHRHIYTNTTTFIKTQTHLHQQTRKQAAFIYSCNNFVFYPRLLRQLAH